MRQSDLQFRISDLRCRIRPISKFPHRFVQSRQAFIALWAVTCLLAACSRQADLPVLGAVPEFSLKDQETRVITRKDLAGKIWIADFIFTSCGGICPDMTGAMRRLQDKLPPDIQFVSFSVDPAHDTPDVLAAYAAKAGADSKRWFFLTGDREALYKLSMEGFKLPVDDTTGTTVEPVTHSSRFVLVDRDGEIRGYYGMDDAGAMERLAADARRLL
jgi:protein SCO1/2